MYGSLSPKRSAFGKSRAARTVTRTPRRRGSGGSGSQATRRCTSPLCLPLREIGNHDVTNHSSSAALSRRFNTAVPIRSSEPILSASHTRASIHGTPPHSKRSNSNVSPSPPFHSHAPPPSRMVVVLCTLTCSAMISNSTYTSFALPRSMLSRSCAASTVTATVRRRGSGGIGNHWSESEILGFFPMARLVLLRRGTISSLYHALSAGIAPAARSIRPFPISSSMSISSSKQRTSTCFGGPTHSISNDSPAPQRAFAPPSTAVVVRTVLPSTSMVT